ncbi:glycogen/starch/alpha-glucan phosphorylase [Tepidibacillus fermentans]|uniref:Alpha-1,4 glucan phosphorylase n=1 Tax=Tepidibacillus fermentans TaxID=1281767 RepID=A0A4R3KD47_9BACI|nr:glycogen/starch/alpha-glucan phosphorylase [Tepidibacillus fermentans]TCS81077.1 starch phosphorylase [Tepidibacillus fermentans]
MFLDKKRFKNAFLERLENMYGKNINESTTIEQFMVLGSMVKEHISKNWILTKKNYRERGEKQVYYLSIEFLLGRMLGTNLLNLGIREIVEEGLRDLDISLEKIEQQEPDPGLGNGGLGRLAACFLDSLASLHLPGHGCGIRYKYGLFEQKIVDGYQIELPDYWLREGNVWEVRRSDKAVEVRFGGNVWVEKVGERLVFHHENYESVLAVPYDIPVPGYKNKTVNTLRLWSAESAIKDFDFQCLNNRDYQKIIDYKRSTESISEFLYPDDSKEEGKILRLKQQYFLVSAGLQSIIRSYKKRHQDIHDLPNKVAIHINDTHPVLAIPELMRILMDEEGLEWDQAWSITTRTISYTNHTTLQEALERWPIDMMKTLLPRIYMIIEEINERFCRELWNKYPGEWDLIHQMAIIADGQVKMAHLAIVGSYQVNGVSKIHTEILKKQVMKNFYACFPYKFHNKTNGITHRRWLLKANPLLAKIISDTISPNWIEHPSDLNYLQNYAKDPSFQEQIFLVKKKNKISLSNYIQEKYNISVDPNSIFDVQVKRLHAYKRQLLNVFYIMDLYNRLKENPDLDIIPRTFIFGAKAAPGYFLAKRIIKLINTVATVINNDPTIHGKIKVIFIENYGVTLAEKIIPAADIGQQISTASKEASGTGNMKFMMNGALTLGTLDGANIEIKDEVGDNNIFIFGLTPQEVLHYYQQGGYRARDFYQSDPRLRKILDQLMNGFFLKEVVEFKFIYYSLLQENDEFFVLKDFAAYADTQQRIDQSYRDHKAWTEKSIINIAHSGIFSSDRTIYEYASGTWEIRPIFIP